MPEDIVIKKTKELKLGQQISGYTVVRLYPEKDLVIFKTPRGSGFRIETMSKYEHVKTCPKLDEAELICKKR